MSFVIRGKGTVKDIAEIGAIFIKSIGGSPIYLRDIANVELDYPPPTGIFSKDYHDESIEGIVRHAPRREPFAGARAGARRRSRS